MPKPAKKRTPPLVRVLFLPWPPTVNTAELCRIAPRTSGVYRIEEVGGRFYIGSAVDLGKRWSDHVRDLHAGRHPNRVFQAVWNKRPGTLTFRVIRFVPAALLLVEEQRELDAAGVGTGSLCMNILPVAGSHLGRKRSSETKAKMSAAQRGRTFSDATRALMRAAKLGRRLSPVHRAKIAAAGRGRPGPKPTTKTYAARKLSENQVRRLRALVAAGTPVARASRETGISRAVARRIIAGEAYAGFGEL